MPNLQKVDPLFEQGILHYLSYETYTKLIHCQKTFLHLQIVWLEIAVQKLH